MWPFGVGNKYPYTDFHELNTDYLIEKTGKIDQNLKDSETAREGAEAAQAAAETAQAAAETAQAAAETAQDGAETAEENTEEYYNNLQTHIADDVTSWLTANVDPVGSAVVVDSSLTISGAAADAKVTGDSINDLNIDIEHLSPNPEITWVLNRNVQADGTIAFTNYMALTNEISVSSGDMIRRKTISTLNNRSIIGYISEFTDSGVFIRRNGFNTYNQTYEITDSNTAKVRVSFGRTSTTGIAISESDIDYFKISVIKQSISKTDGFVNRGAISQLGYTSIAQCVQPGYYTFGGSDVITDLPAGWSGGGLIVAYRNKNVIWQRLISNKYRFIRYGTSAPFRNEDSLINIQYIEESGENQSDAKINVFIPRDVENRRTMYQLGHCVDASNNANVWRIMFAYRVDTGDTLRKLTMTGEWECAVHLDGRDDFSGGIVHGDEVDTSVTFIMDGTVVDASALNGFCKELKIIRKSNLYDPADHITVIAEHGVEYVFTSDGVKIRQSINWKVSATLTACYLAMLPIIKAYSKYRYDDTSFDIVENTQTDYTVTIPDANSVTEYSTDYDCLFTVAKEEYPTGLIGGDSALITDNGGLNYNKIYFPVCTSGTSQIGELWKSTTVFKNR